MDPSDRFEAVQEEFLKFENVQKKRSGRRDIHAFLLLDELFPGGTPVVDHAEHDQIWLDGPDEPNLTDDQIVELVRCGIMYEEGDGFSMFV